MSPPAGKLIDYCVTETAHFTYPALFETGDDGDAMRSV